MKLLTEWAVTSSILILIVLAARLLLKDRLSARLRYALWGVVLLRLLVPFQVELPAQVSDSLPLLASNVAPRVERWEEPSIPVFPQEDFAAFGLGRADIYRLEPGEIIPTNTSIGYWQKSQDGETITRYLDLWSPAQVVTVIWGAGAGLTALVILTSNLRFGRRLRKRRKPLEGVDAPVPVYVAEGLPSPCLTGVLRPAVYMPPQAAEDPDALRHVLAHELTHYAHLDHIWALLRCLALALHWYNPLVWLAAALSKRDGELACDEGAVARLGEGERIPYGRTLVDMVAAQSLRPADLLSCSTAMTGGKKSIQRRVAALVKKPETVKTALFAAIALVALSLVFVFAGRKNTAALDEYRSAVEGLERVELAHYAVPTYVIEDPELLEQAKTLLACIDPAGVGEAADVEYGSPGITLFRGGPEGQDILMEYSYQLQIGHSGGVRVVRFLEGEPSSQYLAPCEVVGCLPDNAYERLVELAGQQENQTGSGSPELSRFLAEVEWAVSIWADSPTQPHYPAPVTDSDLVAMIKDHLSTFVLPGKDDILPAPEELTSVNQLVLSDGERESIYTLAMWNDYTWLIPGDVNLKEVQKIEYGDIFRSAEEIIIGGRISGSVVLQTYRVSTNDSGLYSISSELSKYTPEFLQELGITQLQGLPGGMENMKLHSGYISRGWDLDRIQLKYWGDEEHAGLWVLDMETPAKYADPSVIDHTTVFADQPNAVFNAGLGADLSLGQPRYQTMDPDSFALLLRPEDVISVTAGRHKPGQAIDLDIPAMQEQLTWALHHQLYEEYDEEKYRQYVINIEVTGADYASYNAQPLAMEEDKRLTISAGSEQDVVCLYHRTFADTQVGQYVFARSPELYHTIRNIFD